MITFKNATDKHITAVTGTTWKGGYIVLDALPGWVGVSGKMVIEIRPSAFSKGSAVQAFMAEPPFAGRKPVFVGDDTTDEDGMKAAEALGGFGIKVGEGDSVARYRLSDPDAVHAWLGVRPE